ncbi:MAG: rhomboid family intramembrane serine protease [Verrucomicrobiota bacterium]|nr:rhomboid family intramembrane serine protease [Verrucomicrobiota bacterium]
MLDLNQIFLLIAAISPAILLFQTWRGAASPHWRTAALFVLLVVGAAWLFARPWAGFISGGAWLLLLFLPATALRKSIEVARRGRFPRARRLLNAVRFLHSGRAVREHAQLIDMIERAQAEGRAIPAAPGARGSSFGRSRTGTTPAVATLIVLNLAMFAAQMAFGGSTNPMTLHRLGALEPATVLVNGEYWRLATAIFLHYGAAHLLVNLFALHFFGPTLESAIGSLRFAVCYLLSGIGSCAEITMMSRLQWLEIDQLVGASAAVMGIVGAWAGSLMRDRHLPHNRRVLRNILLIVAIQSLFDILTPRVSIAAHLSGLVTGFVLGLLIAPKRRSTA